MNHFFVYIYITEKVAKEAFMGSFFAYANKKLCKVTIFFSDNIIFFLFLFIITSIITWDSFYSNYFIYIFFPKSYP